MTRSQLKRSFKKLKIFCPAFGDLFWGVGGVRGGGGVEAGFFVCLGFAGGVLGFMGFFVVGRVRTITDSTSGGRFSNKI